MENLIKITQIEHVSASTLMNKLEEIQTQIKSIHIYQPKESDKLLTKKEVAKLLGVSLLTVNNWSANKTLNPYKIGNMVRFKQSQILNSLQQINI